MQKFLWISTLFFYFFTSTSLALYPIPEYEIQVLESIPPEIRLDMNLGQILQAKEDSAFQAKKDKVYEVITKHVGPLIVEQLADDYNLVKLAASLPAEEILADLLASDAPGSSSDTPSDFIILVLPKLSKTNMHKQGTPYEELYLKTKAPVIDSQKVGFSLRNDFDTQTNEKLQKTIHFAFERNLVELNNTHAFFVGALIHIHLDGQTSQVKFQVAGALPINLNHPFEEIVDQAHFKAVKTPRPPASGWAYKDYPGAIVDAVYSQTQGGPAKVIVNFGKLGKIEDGEWKLARALKEIDSNEPSNTGEMGVRSFARRYNVPNLWGDIKEASGVRFVDFSLAALYNIQINIHQLEIDMLDLKVTSMRTTVELPPKENNWFTAAIEPGLRIPTFEVPSVTQQVLDGANDAIEPYRAEVQFFVDNAERLLSEPKLRSNLLNLIYQMTSNSPEDQ